MLLRRYKSICFAPKLPFSLCNCISWSLLSIKTRLDVQEIIGKVIFKRNGKKVREGRDRQRREGEEGRGRTHSCV